MIDIKTKIHDKFSIEFKVGFVNQNSSSIDDFNMAMWIFIPESLDINYSTYPKESFYQDVKSNIRLITPIYRINEVASGDAQPLKSLEQSIHVMADDQSESSIKDYEFNLKMFAAIVKSSLRDMADQILSEPKESLDTSLESFCSGIVTILDGFHSLKSSIISLSIPKKHLDTYRYADEFICHNLNIHIYKIINFLEECHGREYSDVVLKLKNILKDIDEYRTLNEYPVIKKDDNKNNGIFVHRQSSLKKFIERQMYLRVPKKKDGVVVEQLYYSIAAGLAMIFATMVAWIFQSTFGNLTWPLFIALIISYMMKDRIKELTRFYFAHKRLSKYYDNKAKISLKDIEIGWLKENMNFMRKEHIPVDILEKRHVSPLVGADRRIGEDNVILYRKMIHLDGSQMGKICSYSFPGINDIIRLHVNRFVQKMDNPKVKLLRLTDELELESVICDKNYYINIILQYTYAGITEFKRFRITINRDGISEISPIAL